MINDPPYAPPCKALHMVVLAQVTGADRQRAVMRVRFRSLDWRRETLSPEEQAEHEALRRVVGDV